MAAAVTSEWQRYDLEIQAFKAPKSTLTSAAAVARGRELFASQLQPF